LKEEPNRSGFLTAVLYRNGCVDRRINLECNTYVHERNVRNLPVSLSLFQLAKTLGPSYYCLYSLFNKIRDKGKTVSAWKRGGGGEREGMRGKGRGRGKGEEMTQTLYAHMIKRLKKNSVTLQVSRKKKKKCLCRRPSQWLIGFI
jgi:hypothetical protein